MRANTPAPKHSIPNWVAAVFASLIGRNADFCPRQCSRQSRRKLHPEAAFFGYFRMPKSSYSAWGVSRNGSRPPPGSAVSGPKVPDLMMEHSLERNRNLLMRRVT